MRLTSSSRSDAMAENATARAIVARIVIRFNIFLPPQSEFQIFVPDEILSRALRRSLERGVCCCHHSALAYPDHCAPRGPCRTRVAWLVEQRRRFSAIQRSL